MDTEKEKPAATEDPSTTTKESPPSEEPATTNKPPSEPEKQDEKRKDPPPSSSPAVKAADTPPPPSSTQQSPSRMVSDETLIQLLGAEVERLKLDSAHNRSEIDHKKRDEERTNVMLRLAQEQLVAQKESQDLVHRQMQRVKEENGRLSAEAEKLRQSVGLMEDELKVANIKREHDAAAHHDERQRLMEDISRLEGTNARLRRDLEVAKETADRHDGEREKKERALFETQVALKSRLKQTQEELDHLKGLRERETKTITEREYELSKEIASLKKDKHSLEQDVDASKRSHYEEVTLLKNEVETLRLKMIQGEGMLKATSQDSQERITRLTHELSLAKEQAQSDFFAAQSRERVLEAQNAKLCSDLKVAQQEINEFSGADAEKRQQTMEAQIQLHAERDAALNRLRTLEREHLDLKERHKVEVVQLRTQMDLAHRESQEAQRKAQTESALRRDEVHRLNTQFSTTSVDLEKERTAKADLQREREEEHERMMNEMQKLAVERDGYKQTVEKLDKHIKENYAVRILEDEVSSLKDQNAALRNQLSHANNTLANLRVESDIGDNHRIKVMQENVDDINKRLQALERERRFARPLIKDLIATVQQHNVTDASLDSDIDVFLRNFGVK